MRTRSILYALLLGPTALAAQVRANQANPLQIAIAAGATGGTAGYPVGPVGNVGILYKPADTQVALRVDGFIASFAMPISRETDAGALVGFEWMPIPRPAGNSPYINIGGGFFGSSGDGNRSQTFFGGGPGVGLLLGGHLSVEGRVIFIGNGNIFVPLTAGLRF